eukprot:SAG31_NODE_5230_length_2660_cov_6.073799_1_plen_47_part_10
MAAQNHRCSVDPTCLAIIQSEMVIIMGCGCVYCSWCRIRIVLGPKAV